MCILVCFQVIILLRRRITQRFHVQYGLSFTLSHITHCWCPSLLMKRAGWGQVAGSYLIPDFRKVMKKLPMMGA